MMKSTKNDVEAHGMANAHIKDAVAVCKWAAKIERDMKKGLRNYTEISAANLLEQYRNQQEGNKGLSFNTIAAYGAHGAIIHYGPKSTTNIPIGTDSLFLGRSHNFKFDSVI